MSTTKDTPYFPHDSNAADDPKVMLMMSQLGLESYGAYWILIEHLRQQPGYRLPLVLLDPLSRRYGSSKEKFEIIVRNYGLFEIDENNFFSPSLIRRMEPVDVKREQQRQNALKRWGKDATALPPHSHGNTMVMQKRREEKRKEENRIEERKEQFALAVKEFEKVYPLAMLNAFISYWTEKNKSGTKMKYELEKTFEIPKRLTTWSAREKDFGTSRNNTERPIFY